MSLPTTAAVDILLVEDDSADALLMREALTARSIRHRVHHVRDGVEAMSFLLRSGEHANVPRPGLILLDLNLPRMDGRAVLAEIKADEDLRSIPVVVLTTSSAETDLIGCYSQHANAFITKPIELDQFSEIVRKVDEFYLSTAKIPRKR